MIYESMDTLETVKIPHAQLLKMYELLCNVQSINVRLGNGQLEGWDTVAVSRTKDGWQVLSIKTD